MPTINIKQKNHIYFPDTRPAPQGCSHQFFWLWLVTTCQPHALPSKVPTHFVPHWVTVTRMTTGGMLKSHMRFPSHSSIVAIELFVIRSKESKQSIQEVPVYEWLYIVYTWASLALRHAGQWCMHDSHSCLYGNVRMQHWSPPYHLTSPISLPHL